MSDANKSMIDASGRLIRGATHPYVLADDLYPMKISIDSVDFFWRAVYNATTSCPATDAWSLGWVSIPDGAYGAYADITGALSRTYWQAVAKITLASNSIDWSRVKKIQLPMEFQWSARAGDTDGWEAKITTAADVGTIPSDYGVLDSWYLSNTFAVGDPSSWEEKKIEWEINGVEPTYLFFASFIDIDTCGQIGEARFDVQEPSSTWSAPHLIYNLATA
jgi:hypothetical protein